MNKVLILSPHTDDAELGAGGTICKYLDQGKEIFWIVFSTAEESLPENMPKDTLEKEFVKVTCKLGLKNNQYLIKKFHVRKLHEKRQEILEILVEVRNNFKPDLVLGPSLNDFHQDHIVVATEMVRAFKSHASILSYELPWNNVIFKTQYFEKLSKKQIKLKQDILKCYHSQVVKERNYFDDDFIYGFAKTRGVQVNAEFAESFEVVRWINN